MSRPNKFLASFCSVSLVRTSQAIAQQNAATRKLAEAERMDKLADGKDNLLQAARDALAEDDNQWATQLADHLLAINKDDTDAKQVKAEALAKLARCMVNATARNYYLTVARELRAGATPK